MLQHPVTASGALARPVAQSVVLPPGSASDTRRPITDDELLALDVAIAALVRSGAPRRTVGLARSAVAKLRSRIRARELARRRAAR